MDEKKLMFKRVFPSGDLSSWVIAGLITGCKMRADINVLNLDKIKQLECKHFSSNYDQLLTSCKSQACASS